MATGKNILIFRPSRAPQVEEVDRTDEIFALSSFPRSGELELHVFMEGDKDKEVGLMWVRRTHKHGLEFLRGSPPQFDPEDIGIRFHLDELRLLIETLIEGEKEAYAILARQKGLL